MDQDIELNQDIELKALFILSKVTLLIRERSGQNVSILKQDNISDLCASQPTYCTVHTVDSALLHRLCPVCNRTVPFTTDHNKIILILAANGNYSKYAKYHERQSKNISISVGIWSPINTTQLHACLIFWDGWQFAWEASFRNLSMLVSHEIWISLADQSSICMQDVHGPVGVCVFAAKRHLEPDSCDGCQCQGEKIKKELKQCSPNSGKHSVSGTDRN